MNARERGRRLKRFAGGALALFGAGILSLAVGLIMLCLKNWIAGGVLSACGALLLAGGGVWGNRIIWALKRNQTERAREVSLSAFLLYGDLFGVLEADGVRLCHEGDPQGEEGRVSSEKVVFWRYLRYRRPNGRGMPRVTVAIPTSELPAEGRMADRGEEISYYDIDDDAIFDQAEELGYSAFEKSGKAERPVKIERYGDITVYDCGLYFAKLWTEEKRRFLPWADVEKVSRAGDELHFDCGYQQFAARYDERFFRDLEANYPDKIAPSSECEGTVSEKEPAETV